MSRPDAAEVASLSPLRFTPFHAAGLLFIAVGLVLATYRGLMAFGAVPAIGWMTWSHIHFVTIGGFTQLLFGTMPQLAARKLDRPLPSKRYVRATFLALNGSVLVLWYGRAFGHPLAFDAGLAVVWVTVASLVSLLSRMVIRSTGGRAYDATVRLYLLSTAVFLVGILYAIGLYSHPWNVPGGWHGLREAHVHANAWGFLGLAAIGTLYELFPRLVRTNLYSERLKAYSFWLFAAGIVPLITGPWLGLGRTVTMPGLVLYGAGFVLYAYDLFRTYLAGSPNRIARSVLVAQVWILGPAVFAPFLLFGLPLGIDGAWVEQGALHFFFVGWALPIALAGLLVYFRNLPCLVTDASGRGDRVASDDLLPAGTIPTGIPAWVVAVWNVAVLAVGLGFFFQDQAFATILQGVGWPVLVGVWAYQLSQAVRIRLAVRRDAVRSE
ncbi:MAG: hypothetical protein ABEI96_09700 [Haloarculaceae archaeon]